MIGATETALLARVRELFGTTLRKVDTHPGTWDDNTLKRIIAATPSVYLAWLGCGAGRTAREVESRWVFYVVAQLLNGRDDRLGAYQITERLIAGIARCTFGPSTGMRLTKALNLYSDERAAQGAVLYGLYFTAITPLPDAVDVSTLPDFERHYQTWAVPDGTPVTEDHINVNEEADG